MAYLVTDEDEQKDDEQENALTGAAPASGSAASSAPAPAAAAQPQSDFVSFDRYYAANADAAKNTANQLASSAETAATKAEKGINNASTAVEKATGNSAPVSQARLERESMSANEGPAQVPVYSNIITQGERDMGAVGTTEEEARRGAAASYRGPGSLLDAQFGDLSGDVEHAGQQLRSLQSPEGIQAAMHGASDGGMADSMDAALVGRAGAPRFRELKDRYGSLSKLLTDKTAYSAGLADRARATTATDAGRYQAVLDAWFKEKKRREEAAKYPGSAAKSTHINMTSESPV